MPSIKSNLLLVLMFVLGLAGGVQETQAAGTLSPVSGSNNQVQINQALKSGGVVHLNAGTYTISDTIVLNSGNTLEGDSGAKIVLVSQANWPKYKNMVEGLGVSNVRITGFEIDGNRAANETSNGADTSCGLYYYTMIYFKDSKSIEVDHMYLHHNWNDTLKFSSCNNVTFHNNTVRQPGHDVVYAIKSSNVWVFDNYIRIYCNSGVRPDGTTNIHIYNNDIARDVGAGGYAGIEVQGSSTVYICNNNIHDTKGGSIVDLSGGSAKISYSGCTTPSSGMNSGGTNPDSGSGDSGSGSDSSSGASTVTTTDSDGNTTTTVTDSTGSVTVTKKDSAGNVISTSTGTTTKDSAGNTVTTTTDSQGNVTTITTDASGKVTYNTKDRNGNITSSGTGTTSTDASGNTVTTITDDKGNVTTTTTDASGNVTSTTRDANGNVISTSTGTSTTTGSGTGIVDRLISGIESLITSLYGSAIGDSGSSGSIDNRTDDDIPQYYDPDTALTDANSSGATGNALAPAEKELKALFDTLGESASTATAVCSSIAGSGGLLPCGKSVDDPNTAWNECDKCDLCSMVLLGQLSITFLIKIAAFTATLAIIFAGYVYIFALGKTDLTRKAKLMIRYSLIGLAIIFLAWIIVDGLLSTLGYIDPIEGSWYTIC